MHIFIIILLILLVLLFSNSPNFKRSGIFRALGGDTVSGRENKTVKSDPSDEILNVNTLSNFYKVSSEDGSSVLYLEQGDVVFSTPQGKISLLTGEADLTIGDRIPIVKLTSVGNLQIISPGDNPTVLDTLGSAGSVSNYVLRVTSSSIFADPLPINGVQGTPVQIYPKPSSTLSSINNSIKFGQVIQSPSGSTLLYIGSNGDLTMEVNGVKTVLVSSGNSGSSLTLDSNNGLLKLIGGVTEWSLDGWLPETSSYSMSITDDGSILINTIQVYPNRNIDLLKSDPVNQNTQNNIINRYTTLKGVDGVSFLKSTSTGLTVGKNTYDWNYLPLIKLMNDGSVRAYDYGTKSLPDTGSFTNSKSDVSNYQANVDSADLWVSKEGNTVKERVFAKFSKVVSSVPNNSFDINTLLIPQYNNFVNQSFRLEMSANGSLRCKNGQYSSSWSFDGSNGYSNTLSVDNSGKVLYGGNFMGTYAINSSDPRDFNISQFGELFYDFIRVYIVNPVISPYPSQLFANQTKPIDSLMPNNKLLSTPSYYFGLENNGKDLNVVDQSNGAAITKVATSTLPDSILTLNNKGEVSYGGQIIRIGADIEGDYKLVMTDYGLLILYRGLEQVFTRRLFNRL